MGTSLQAAEDRMEALRAEFREKGFVKLEGLLDQEALTQARRCYDWTLSHPSPIALEFFESEGGGFYNDAAGHKASKPVYEALFEQLPVFAEACQALWGTGPKGKVWFFDHEVFRKTKGKGRGTPFHQDTGYYPFHGEHLAVFWIPFEDTPQENSLEFVEGSHKGPLYNAAKVFGVGSLGQKDPTMTDTTPLYPEKLANYPQLPEIEKERNAWSLKSLATKRGDVMVFHPGTLHGGAPVDANFPERNCLVFRFFGDDCVYRTLPESAKDKWYANLKDGDHFSLSKGGKWMRIDRADQQGAAGSNNNVARL